MYAWIRVHVRAFGRACDYREASSCDVNDDFKEVKFTRVELRPQTRTERDAACE